MTWDDNILTRARTRHKLLKRRINRITAYADRRIFIEYENGVAVRMFIDPNVKAAKARRIAQVIRWEMSELEKVLKKFV